MKTTVKTKRVNTLFDFLKTALLPVEQMIAAFFSSKTQTGLSLTPRAEASYNKSNGTKKPVNKSFAMAVVLLSLLFVGTAFGQKTWDAGGGNSNWNTAANWLPDGVPISTDDVTIADGISVTVDVNAVCKSLTMTGGTVSNVVTISGTNSLSVTGAVTIGAITSGTAIQKNINVGAGSLTCASISSCVPLAVMAHSFISLLQK